MSKHTYTKSYAASGPHLGKHATLALSHRLSQGHVSVSKQYLHCHRLSQGHVSVSKQHLHCHRLSQGHVSVSKQLLQCHMLSQGHVSVSIEQLHYKLHCVTGSGSHEGLPAYQRSTRLPIEIRAEKIKELRREDPPISSS